MKIRHIFMIILLSLIIGVQGAVAQKQVKLLSLTWEPYAGPDMPKQGFCAAIVSMAFEKAGYDVDIEFNNWDLSLAKAKNGEADGVFPTYHTKEREAYLLYSNSFAQSPLGLCKLRPVHSFSPGGTSYDKIGKENDVVIRYKTDPRIDQVQALRDLSKYKFGVGKGYANTPEFDSADFLTKVLVANDVDNVMQLLQGDVELIVIDKYVAKNIMAKKFPWRTGDVQFMEPALAMNDLYLTLSKKADNAAQKLEDFNNGLKILQEDGTIKRIMRVYGF